MKIILASGSPRRRELLKFVVPKFEIMVSDVDEKIKEGISIQEQAERLAYLKAKDIFEKTSGNRIVIGSDTIVYKDNIIYGKAEDRKEAKNYLKKLLEGDKSHNVITGLCVLTQKNGKTEKFITYDETKVFLKDINENEMDMWLDSGEWKGKAGAYGIQDRFGVFIEKIEGNYNTVVGLPINKLYDIMKKII